MSQFETASFIKFFGFCGLLLIILGIVKIAGLHFKIHQRKERNEKIYLSEYIGLKYFISHCKLNSKDEDHILTELKRIAKLPMAIKDHNQELGSAYLKKFYGKDELAPEQLDADRISRDLKIINENRF